MNKTLVKDLVQEALEKNKSLFLIELSFLPNNKIFVEVDGDNGISLKEIMRITRNIEGSLDREEEDFSLEVTSPDISKPLKVKRQYFKNINRILNVQTLDNEFEGTLTEVKENSIILQWKERAPKPIGKGKITLDKTVSILDKEIKQAKVKIVF